MKCVIIQHLLTQRTHCADITLKITNCI